jgi:hypothetical protein
MLGTEFPYVSSNIKVGMGVFGTCDPFNSALPNNGALNPPGSLWFMQAPAQAGTALGIVSGAASSAGYGSGLWVKYVLYRSTGNPAMVTGPAPVYWADESFTTVTGKYTEGLPTASNSVSAAGWLLPNTGTVAGVGLGTTLMSATILNNGGHLSSTYVGGSWVFIGIQGWIPSCYLAAGSIGQRVYASGDFSTTGVASDGASTYSDFNLMGTIVSTVSSNIADVLAYGPLF